MSKFTVIKNSGVSAAFDEAKLRNSLKRSGANTATIDLVANQVVAELYDGITTKEIFKKAFSLLRKNAKHTAARYKLKKAIMELGPTGYPFERFVGEILKHQGFETKVGVAVKGHCVTHEVDVVAEKDNLHFMVECKFHGDSHRHCDVKIPLYIHSRFKDVERQWQKQPGHSTKFHQGWIFTNTRFTSDAIQFGRCSGLMLVGWDFPKNNGLKHRIDMLGLHPITCLTTLTLIEKQRLLAQMVVLCKSLCENPEVLNAAFIKAERHKAILDEARELCLSA